MRERIAENPVPFQVLSCVLIVMGLSFVGCGMHRRDPIPELWVERPSEGFCCWRDKPSPFYAGDPCACPREHRGDFPCPPEGCSEERVRAPGNGGLARQPTARNSATASWRSPPGVPATALRPRRHPRRRPKCRRASAAGATIRCRATGAKRSRTR
ncbi:unnamed protein product [Effrenium voratum]|nr:unnamed protein product [Effrenium voratum]